MSTDAAIGRRKRRLTLVMTALLLAVYAGFLVLLRYAQPWMRTPVGPVTVAILVAAGVIVAFCVLSLIYVIRSNRMQAEQDARHERA